MWLQKRQLTSSSERGLAASRPDAWHCCRQDRAQVDCMKTDQKCQVHMHSRPLQLPAEQHLKTGMLESTSQQHADGDLFVFASDRMAKCGCSWVSQCIRSWPQQTASQGPDAPACQMKICCSAGCPWHATLCIIKQISRLTFTLCPELPPAAPVWQRHSLDWLRRKLPGYLAAGYTVSPGFAGDWG